MRLTVPLLLWGSLPLALSIWQFEIPRVPKTNLFAGITGTYLPLPSQDPWYTAPEGWESTKPGTVLRIRPHAYNMTPIAIANVASTFQVLFRSTSSLKNATWGVTTVFLPIVTNKTQPRNYQSIVSYQLPYDTSCLDASPSFGLQFGDPYGEITTMLSRGWWVSVPDFEGPLASYGANIVAGYITLDSIRAVLSAAATEYNITNARFGLWGYSNGASATEVAVEFQTDYALDLRGKIKGAAIGGLTPNLQTSGPLLAQTQVSGLLVQGIIGVTSQYPEQRAYVVRRLKDEGPYNRTEFFWASYMSGWQSLLYYSYVNVFEYFIGGRADLEVQDIMDMFDREGTLGKFGLPETTVFQYHAIDDDMTKIEETDSLVQKFCDQGANILYHRNTWGGHNDELTNGRQRALDFLGHVLDGTTVLEVPEKGCQVVNITFMQDLYTPFT